MGFLIFCWLVVAAGFLELGYFLGKAHGRKRADAEWAVWAEHGAL